MPSEARRMRGTASTADAPSSVSLRLPASPLRGEAPGRWGTDAPGKEVTCLAKNHSRPAGGGPVPGAGRLRARAGAGGDPHPHAQRHPRAGAGGVRPGLLPVGGVPPHHRHQPHQSEPGRAGVRGAVRAGSGISGSQRAVRLLYCVRGRPDLELPPAPRRHLLRRQRPHRRRRGVLPGGRPHQRPLLRPVCRHRRRVRHGGRRGDRHPHPGQREPARPAGHPHRAGGRGRPPGHRPLRAHRRGGELEPDGQPQLAAGPGEPVPALHPPAGHPRGGRAHPRL